MTVVQREPLKRKKEYENYFSDRPLGSDCPEFHRSCVWPIKRRREARWRQAHREHHSAYDSDELPNRNALRDG